MSNSFDSQPNHLPATIILDYLDGAGNHELKNALSGVFLQNPHIQYTASAMANEMTVRQGDTPVWKVRPTMVTQYVEHSLMPISSVMHDLVTNERGKVVDTWAANPEYLDARLALSGFISDWSLRWQDISVQQAYGSSSSPGAVRSPQARHNIYSAILTGSDTPSIYEISETLEGGGYSHGRISITGQIKALAQLGILDLATKRQGYNPIIKINDTEFSRAGFDLSETIPETQALYQVMSDLGQGATTGLNELVAKAAKIDPSIDQKKLRLLIRQAVNGGTAYPGLEQIASNGMDQTSQSRVGISESAKKPVEELVEGISSIQNTGEAVEHYIQRSKEIHAEPESFAALVEKARNFSRRANSPSKEVVYQQVETIVRQLGAVSAQTVCNSLAELYGTKLSKPHTRTRLNELVEQGVIKVKTVNQEAHTTRQINIYSTDSDVLLM